MTTTQGHSATPVVLLALDAAPEVGVGHAIRCQALAEELVSRGHSVAHVGDMDVPWVAAAYRRTGIELLGDLPVVAAAADPRVVAVVVDSYSMPPATAVALRELGRPVLAIVDDSTRDLVADLYLEQNLGSSAKSLGVDPPEAALCGPQFTLLRDLVLGRRDQPWRPADAGPRLRVAVLFGGTDPAHGAPAVARTLARSGVPMEATIMAASTAHRAELAQVSWAADQCAKLVDPRPDFIAELATADLVVSAGGTTVYELMALGRPSVICTVADNQERNYAQLVESGLALGLGRLVDLVADPMTSAAQLRHILRDSGRLAEVAALGFRAVDGRGRQRVADRLLHLTAAWP